MLIAFLQKAGGPMQLIFILFDSPLVYVVAPL